MSENNDKRVKCDVPTNKKTYHGDDMIDVRVGEGVLLCCTVRCNPDYSSAYYVRNVTSRGNVFTVFSM